MALQAAKEAGADPLATDIRRGVAAAPLLAAAIFSAALPTAVDAQNRALPVPPTAEAELPQGAEDHRPLPPSSLLQAPFQRHPRSADAAPVDADANRTPAVSDTPLASDSREAAPNGAVVSGPVLSGAAVPAPASDQLLRLVASLVRQNIPQRYQNDKEWEQTKKVYAGVKLRRDGWQLKTKRRWKEARHGRWRRYRVELIDPDQRLEVRLSDFRWLTDNRFQVRLTVLADMELFARQARWNYDVQLYSVHVDARARLQIEVDATIGFHLDPTEIPPALVVAPVVDRAGLDLRRFEVDRISHLGGDLAEELGDAAEGFIRREIVERQSEKLADRVNRQIERHRDDLRISVADWLAEWLATK